MKPFKAALFISFCLGGLIITGTALSHCWNTNKELSHMTEQLSQLDSLEKPLSESDQTP